MSTIEIVICDDCGVECREDPEDWRQLGWRQNVDNDDFCPKCALLLDPPEDDEAEYQRQRQIDLSRGAQG